MRPDGELGSYWTFDAGASNYTFNITSAQDFTGAGIIINGLAVLCRSCSANIPITSAAARPSLTNADIIRIGLSICPKNNLCPAHR